jgi:chromate transporter
LRTPNKVSFFKERERKLLLVQTASKLHHHRGETGLNVVRVFSYFCASSSSLDKNERGTRTTNTQKRTRTGEKSKTNMATATTKGEDDGNDDVEKKLGRNDDDKLVDSAASYGDIFRAFVLMGWTAFGGPAAHIGIFQKVFVDGKRWISSTIFAELLSLGQCLPGPTSTQVSFALGVTQRGVSGGLLSGGLFQYPGLILMTLAGAGAAEALTNPSSFLKGLVSGLSVAGVALVVDAAVNLSNGQCNKNNMTRLLGLTSACFAYYYKTAWLFPLLIVFGGLVSYFFGPNKDIAEKNERDDEVASYGATKIVGGFLILSWAVVLVLMVTVASQTEYDSNQYSHWFAAFFRTGSIIFGGGQVVLPLLLDDVVSYDSSQPDNIATNSWVTEDQFFAGLALVQASPGPMFNFAAYLGAVMAQRAGKSVVAGALTCWTGLFAPGVTLIFGVLPFWGYVRTFQAYQKMLPGLNASAVGLVVAAAVQMFLKVRENSPFPKFAVVIGMLTLFGTRYVKMPNPKLVVLQAPIVVAFGGLLGIIAWATGCD